MAIIDITGLDKAEVLHALYQRAHYKGLGLYSAVIKYSVEDARRDYEASDCKYFDYLYGRVLKVDLSGDSFDSWLYDRDNGIHAAEEAINKLRGENMKAEAIKRIQQLKLDEDVIRAFKDNDILRCSDYGRIIDVPADVRKEIRAWEEKYNNLVYHVIHSGIYGVETYNCLSVSCYPEDWDYENMRLKEGWPMCYSINKTIPDFSESGTIKVEHDKGSLMRIG